MCGLRLLFSHTQHTYAHTPHHNPVSAASLRQIFRGAQFNLRRDVPSSVHLQQARSIMSSLSDMPTLEMTPEELGGMTAKQNKKTACPTPTPKGYRALGLEITPTSWKKDLSKCNVCGESRSSLVWSSFKGRSALLLPSQ